MIARLSSGGAPPPAVLLERLEEAARAFPLLAARLQAGWWVPGAMPGVSSVLEKEPLAAAPVQPFALDWEPPLRVVVPTERDWLLLCGHHFAFDGLGLAALMRALLTGEPVTSVDYTNVSARPRLPIDALERFLRPADRVAPSVRKPLSETFVSRTALLDGRGVTGRLAQACVASVAAHNLRARQPLKRVGVSVAVGGVNGEAATYRRVDVRAGDDVGAAVAEALADERVPPELVGLPPGAFLLRPVLSRFSDTILVSNLGRLDLPGVASLEFYPVARGRSAVAFGAAGLVGRPATLTLRARKLAPEDASRILDRVLGELA